MSEASWSTLEEEFLYYASLLDWTCVFRKLKNTTTRKTISMSELLAAIEGMGFTLLAKGEIYKFVTTVFGGSAEMVSEIISNEVRCFNTQRTAQAFLKASKALKEANIDPKQVGLKDLIPLLEGISLEEDESLQARWENLLTGTIARGKIHPSYTSILRGLDSLDVKVLDKINELFNNRKHPNYKVGESKIFHELLINIASSDEQVTQISNSFSKKQISDEEVNEIKEIADLITQSFDNLIRLNLIEVNGERIKMLPDSGTHVNLHGWGYENAKLSHLGNQFLKAVSSIH